MDSRLQRLPSLDPLKGFDAAARHLSFTKAAAELFLTQSAVSRQIQTLEEQLGVRLFRRETRRLVLTPEGELLHRVVIEILSRLTEVCAGLRAGRRRPRVTVSAAVGIAALWLVPRLSAFQEIEPDVGVRLSADNRIVDLDHEDIDLALRYVSPDNAPSDSVLLFEEEVFPVAAPELAARLPATLCPEDLAQVSLLAFEHGHQAPWLSWDPWLAGMGLANAPPKAVMQFNQYDQLIRAAEDGRGIALGRGPLVAQMMSEGKLQLIGGTRLRVAARGYYLVRTQPSARPEVERFATWLLGEAKQTERDAQA